MTESAPASSQFVGTTRFEVIKRLGEGGMGRVFEVFDREWKTRVALKLLTHLSAERLLLFKNEFRALQDIRHQNLVRLGELFEQQGQWFFTMELIEGCDLLRYIRRQEDAPRRAEPAELAEDDTTDLSNLAAGAAGSAPEPIAPSTGAPFDEDRLRAALTQLAEGLSVLHRAEKVHRDVKPSRVSSVEKSLRKFPSPSDL